MEDEYLEEFESPSKGRGMPYMGQMEAEINNIVGQIDPQTIIDNLDHALKGEQWDKENKEWKLNPSGLPLANDACRGAIISYITGVLTNNTTMANIPNERAFNGLMESIIMSLKRMFIGNLELFGFVPPSERFKQGDYQNKGVPDTDRMTLIFNMTCSVCYLVFSRSLGGEESKRIFKSLSLSDQMGYGQPQQQKKGWMSKIFGG